MLRRLHILFAVLFIVLVARESDAAAAGGVGVSIDGKHVAGYVDTFPDGPIDPAWAKPLMERLRAEPLTFARDYKLAVDPKDDTKATLRGKIAVSTHFRGRDLSTAKAKQLQLSKRGGRWFVANKEVDRMMIAAGLKKEPKKAPKN